MSLYDRAKNSNSSYIPTFVGSNYDELSKAAQTLDTRYRQNKDYSDKIAILAAQDQLLKNDQGIKDAYVADVKDKISKISQSNGNFENSSGAVSQLAKDVFTNPDRLLALDNAKKAEQAKELQRQYGADALNFGDNPSSFSTIHPDTGEKQRFNVGVEKKADYSKKMQELLGKVASDGYTIAPTGDKINFNDYERYLIKSGQVNKLSKDKLHNLVEGLLPSYKVSGEGTQDVRRLNQLEGVTNEPIVVNQYNKNGKVIGTRQTTAQDEDIRQRFRAIADPQAFSQVQQRWEDFGVPVSNKKAIPEGTYTPTNPGSVTDNTSLQPIVTGEGDDYTATAPDGKSYQFLDQTGQLVKLEDLKIPKSYGQAGVDPAALDKAMSQYTRVPVDKTKANAELTSQYNKVTSNIGDIYKDFNNYKESYNQAIKNHSKITPTGNTIAPAQAEQYDQLINRQAVSSPLYFKDAGEPVQGLDALAKKIGTSPSNIKLKAISTFYDSPRADLPGGYVEAKIEVNDSKVKDHPTSVFIPLNDQFASLSKPIDDLYKNSFFAGRDNFTPEKPYIPAIGGQPMRNAKGDLLSFYTVTYPIPKDQQQPGKPAFKTMVYSGKITPNNSGGQDILWDDKPTTIGEWKQNMITALSPLFKNALNSGQTFNTEDYKKQGLDY